MGKIRIALGLSMVLLLQTQLGAQEGGEVVADLILKGRSTVFAGEFSGTRAYYLESGTVLEEQFECAFDHPKQALRFDRFGSEQDKGGQFYRTSLEMGILPSFGEIATLLPTTRRIPGWAKPIETRTLGLAFPGDLEKYQSLEVVCSSFAKMAVERRETLDSGIEEYELIGSYPDGGWKYKRLLRLDPTKDNFVVYMSHRRGFPKQNEEGMDWQPLTVECEVTPIMMDGVAVPSKATVRYEKDRYEYTFDWKSVNREIDRSRFDLKDFDLSAAALISDHRSGTPVVMENLSLTRAAVAQSQRIWTRNIVVATVLALLLALGCGYFFYQRRKFASAD